jgi:hypothetical protein
MKFEIELKNTENVGQITPVVIARFEEIFSALITSGGLTGVKGGKTVLHFDMEGQFMAVSLDYTPWRRRKQEK